MDADIKGCLNNINKSYRMFTHKGKSLTKHQVKHILQYGLEQGYDSTSQIKEVDILIALQR